MQKDWQLSDDWLMTVFPSLAKVTGSVMGAELKLEFLKALKKDPQSALQTIKGAYLKLAKAAKQKRKEGDPWPVIIIDEANLLTRWTDKTSLYSLLAFFVYITKQERLAHVILATSDTYLTRWLESGAQCLAGAAVRHITILTLPHLLTGPIKAPNRSSCVVGNLEAEEAKRFFFDYVLCSDQYPEDADKAWERVFEVCGGNPGLLLKCAGEANAFDSWEQGMLLVPSASLLSASAALLTITRSQGAMPSCKARRRTSVRACVW